MAVEETIEIFQATIILAVLGVVATAIVAPDLGDVLIDVLPGFLTVIIYIFVIMGFAAGIVEIFKR